MVGEGVLEGVEAVDHHVDPLGERQVLAGVPASEDGDEVLVRGRGGRPVDPRAGAEEGGDLAVALAQHAEHPGAIHGWPQRTASTISCASVRLGTSQRSVMRRMTASGTDSLRALFWAKSAGAGAST